MLIERHLGCQVFSSHWQDFLREWRVTPEAQKVVLPDKRPAIRRPPGEGEERASYVTVHPIVWESLRKVLAERMALRAHPKRQRLCQACGAAMRVTVEYEQVWTFSCDVCKSVETWGKDQVGGTIGGGEVEKK